MAKRYTRSSNKGSSTPSIQRVKAVETSEPVMDNPNIKVGDPCPRCRRGIMYRIRFYAEEGRYYTTPTCGNARCQYKSMMRKYVCGFKDDARRLEAKQLQKQGWFLHSRVFGGSTVTYYLLNPAAFEDVEDDQ